MYVASTYVKKEMFSEVDPDLIVFHANELVTMNTIYGAPRTGKYVGISYYQRWSISSKR